MKPSHLSKRPQCYPCDCKTIAQGSVSPSHEEGIPEDFVQFGLVRGSSHIEEIGLALQQLYIVCYIAFLSDVGLSCLFLLTHLSAVS